VCIASALWLSACTNDTQPVADTIYVGGDILTMNDAQPRAEAVAVRGGLILAVGSEADVMKTRGPDTTVIDLATHTLMPGFIDAHSHFFITGLKLATVNLDPPPAGDVESIDDIVHKLRTALSGRPLDQDRWLIGWGYDNAMLADGRHPTRDDLDTISTEVPILVQHFSGHMAVVNSRGLALGGIDVDSIAPEGGVIQRRPDGREPNGILEETAMLPVQREALSQLMGGDDPELARAQAFERMSRTQELYASRGYTTITELAARPEQVALMRAAGQMGLLKLDLLAAVLYLTSTAEVTAELYSESYTNHFRVAGGKVNLDGGSPGRTAFLREPYYKQKPGESDYRGYSSIERQADINDLVASYYALDVPIFIHALGDAAVDQSIEAVTHAETLYPGTDRRTQIIHLQQVQDEPIRSVASTGREPHIPGHPQFLFRRLPRPGDLRPRAHCPAKSCGHGSDTRFVGHHPPRLAGASGRPVHVDVERRCEGKPKRQGVGTGATYLHDGCFARQHARGCLSVSRRPPERFH